MGKHQCHGYIPVTLFRPGPLYTGLIPAMTQAHWRHDVDKNRTEGTKHEVKGAVKEVVGKVTGNKSKQVAGNLEKNAGKIQKEVGKAADDVRDQAKKDRR